MKKLLLLLSITFLLSCSSDDEPAQDSTQTFLEKFDGSGFVDSLAEEYVYFYNSTGVFMKSVETDEDPNFCMSIKVGDQTIGGDSLRIEILQNNSTTLMIEIDYDDPDDDIEVITYTALANGNISADYDGDSTEIFSSTSITFNSLCN
jgi:hypothetical protein